MSKTTLVWFRTDLRLADNPALRAAIRRGGRVVPVYIWAPDEEKPWPPGAASQWWLHHSLQSLSEDLAERGTRLILRREPTLHTLLALIRQTGADAVYWNRRYEPVVQARDAHIASALKSNGVAAESFNSALLHEPGSIQNTSRKPFRVFTAFWKHCLSITKPEAPIPAPDRISSPSVWPASVPLKALGLEPKLNWADGFRRTWSPGERGASQKLKRFMRDAVNEYDENRNLPDKPGTSRLSPHLHFGELSPRQIWHALPAQKRLRSQFVAEIGWREFAHHLLFHFPYTTEEPLRPAFKHFPWRTDAVMLKAWQRGRTGYPIVDAGMRELWATGWMHNRVRMITASFLVKDLLISWRAGAQWFWDTLVDADLAQNTCGWQWTAGCGADAAPFFRIFNPVRQGEKFDPEGAYVRRWCPELAHLPTRWIHQPWKALGTTEYPHRIVNHATMREVALEAYARVTSERADS